MYSCDIHCYGDDVCPDAVCTILCLPDRFVCQGTVEEQIVRLQEKKLKLSSDVLSE